MNPADRIRWRACTGCRGRRAWGRQEYVAVNAAAVVALLLGLVSSSAVLSDVLLVIPAAAVIVAVVAIAQVRKSGGTQTGTGLALAGMLLAILFVTYVGGRAWLKQREIQAEQGQIIAVLDQLSRNVTSKQYDAAWEQFGPLLQSQVYKDAFVRTWQMLEASEGFGPIKGVRWNGILEVQIQPETGAKLANGVILVDTSSGQPARWAAVFRKDPVRGWLIENIDADAFPRHGEEPAPPTPLIPRPKQP